MIKDKLKVVFVGDVDHGKSTLIGRLLYNMGEIPEDVINDMMYWDGKKYNIDFAFLMDRFEEERRKGITIDTTQIFFKTTKRKYVIIDAPGHVEFIVNMITGASQADIAVLIVDASEGIKEQTQRHAYLLAMLGIKKIIVVANKMDLVHYSKAIYDEIILNLKFFLKKIHITEIYTIPISAVNNENITQRTTIMGWYTGLSLIDTLDSINIIHYKKEQTSLFVVQDTYSIEMGKEKQLLILGKVDKGEFCQGQSIHILPENITTKIKSIERYNCQSAKAKCGDWVGLTMEDSVYIKRGNILVNNKNDIKVTTKFKAIVFWMSPKYGYAGKKVRIKCATQEINAYIEKINIVINSATLEVIKCNKLSVKELEICEMVIATQKPIVISEVYEYKQLSRFVITMNDDIIANGVITKC